MHRSKSFEILQGQRVFKETEALMNYDLFIKKPEENIELSTLTSIDIHSNLTLTKISDISERSQISPIYHKRRRIKDRKDNKGISRSYVEDLNLQQRNQPIYIDKRSKLYEDLLLIHENMLQHFKELFETNPDQYKNLYETLLNEINTWKIYPFVFYYY